MKSMVDLPLVGATSLDEVASQYALESVRFVHHRLSFSTDGDYVYASFPDGSDAFADHALGSVAQAMDFLRTQLGDSFATDLTVFHGCNLVLADKFMVNVVALDEVLA